MNQEHGSATGLVAIIQARMSSSRLPGKVLMPLGGMPLLEFMIRRLSQSRTISRIVVATSEEPSDDPIVDAVATTSALVVRGPLDDVLARFGKVDEMLNAPAYLRLTADCPLIDCYTIDRIALAVVEGRADYSSNIDPPTYPDGLDCEAFTSELLRRTIAMATLPSDREHVTPAMRRETASQQETIALPFDLSSLRWTVDYPDDLYRVRKMVTQVRGDPLQADMWDYLRAFQQLDPELANTSHVRNEGLLTSLAKDDSSN